MSKLYVGNLPQEAGEQALRQLLEDQGVACGSVLVKRGGYAFVDCPDQSAADKAIDKLNGKYVRLGAWRGEARLSPMALVIRRYQARPARRPRRTGGTSQPGRSKPGVGTARPQAAWCFG